MGSQCYSDERYSDILASQENVSEADDFVRIKGAGSLSENELLEKVVGNLAVAECSNDTMVIRECMSDIETPDPKSQSDFLKSTTDGEHLYCNKKDSWQVVRVPGDEPNIVKWVKKDWVWKSSSGDELEFQIMRVRPVEPVGFPLLVPLRVQKHPSASFSKTDPGSVQASLLHFKPHVAPPQSPEAHVISIANVHPDIDGSYPYSRPFVLPSPITSEEDLYMGKQDAWSKFEYRMDVDRVLYHVWKKNDAGKKRKHMLSESNWPIRENCSRPSHEFAPRQYLTSSSNDLNDWRSEEFNFDEMVARTPPSDTDSVFGRFLARGSSPSEVENFDCDVDEFFKEGYYGSPPSLDAPNEPFTNAGSRIDTLGGVFLGGGSGRGEWGSGAPVSATRSQNKLEMLDSMAVSRPVGNDGGGSSGFERRTEFDCGRKALTARNLPLEPGLHAVENDSKTRPWGESFGRISGGWKQSNSNRRNLSDNHGAIGQEFGGNGFKSESTVQCPAGVHSNPNSGRNKGEGSVRPDQVSGPFAGTRSFGFAGCPVWDLSQGGNDCSLTSRGENVGLDVDEVGFYSVGWLRSCNKEEWGAFISLMFGENVHFDELQLFVRALVEKMGLERVRDAFEG